MNMKIEIIIVINNIYSKNSKNYSYFDIFDGTTK